MKKKAPKQTKKKTKKKKTIEAQKPLYGPFADWKNPNEYPVYTEADWYKVGWEFLRRNSDYQKAFKEIEDLPPPTTSGIDFVDLPKPKPGESKRNFIKREKLDDKRIKFIDLDSLFKWGTLCVQFGINTPVSPNVNDPSTSLPPLDFCPHLNFSNLKDQIRGSTGVILLDFDEPESRVLKKVKGILKEVKPLLDDPEKPNTVRNLIGVKGPRQGEVVQTIIEYEKGTTKKKADRKIPWESFGQYLRLLDAKASGVRPRDMFCIFQDNIEPEKAVFGGLKKAFKWSNKDYQLFRKEMVCIIRHPELPEALYHLRSSYKGR